jgi:hypothetical protein
MLDLKSVLSNLAILVIAIVLAVLAWMFIKKMTEPMEVVSVNDISPESSVGVGSSTSQDPLMTQATMESEQVQPFQDEFNGSPVNSSQFNANGDSEIVPMDLLPNNDAAAVFAEENPAGTGNVQNVEYLSAGFNIGMDTRGGTMKNPTRDIRPEPRIPKQYVGPFYNSTYEPDLYRGNLCA